MAVLRVYAKIVIHEMYIRKSDWSYKYTLTLFDEMASTNSKWFTFIISKSQQM